MRQGHTLRPPLPLLAIIAIAVLLRCVSAFVQGDQLEALPGIQDQFSYDALARSVLVGHGFLFETDWWPATRAGAPTAHWSFLYTLYLAAVYGIVGWHPIAARLIQAVIAGVLYPWLTWRLGHRLFGPRAGLVAAGMTAVYGYFVYYAGALMTETFYILAILGALDLAMQIGVLSVVRSRAVRPALWLLLGVTLSVAVLLRQLILIFLPVLFLWLTWVFARRFGLPLTRRGLSRWRPLFGGFALSLLVLGVSIAPWTIRNYQAFGRLVVLNTNAGYAFFWANHPIHGTQFVPIFPSHVYYDLIPVELRSLDEAAIDSALMSKGVQFVLDDPGRYVRLSLSRIATYFEFWPSQDSNETSNIARTLSFGVYLPFMLVGLCCTLLGRRSLGVRRQGLEIGLVYAFGIVYTLIHLLSWALIRYRLPLDAVLMPVAGLGVVETTLWLREFARAVVRRPSRARTAGSSLSALGIGRGAEPASSARGTLKDTSSWN
jgi:hypothetical protein